MMDLRLKAYAPNGASQGLLPAPDSFQFAIPLNDSPSLSMAYATVGPRAALLGQPLELAVEVSGDGGQTWTEPDDCRFMYLRDGRDPIKTADAYAVEAPGYVWRLTKARVLSEGQAVEGKRSFTGKTVGFIIATLFQEAQARGALAGMSLQGTATQDAAGANWTAAETISRDYDLGTDYLQVLQALADQGLLDYRMSGRTLKLYRPETVLATDRTVGNSQVQLTPLSVTEAPFRRTWEGLADFLHIRGDEDSSAELTNPAGLKPWGRWEDFISQGGVTDTGTLTALGQRYQELTAAERAEFTQAMALGGDAPRPLLDFQAGDFIWSRDMAGVRTRYRVRQVTLQKEGSTVQGNVVLNDRFLEEDIRTRRVLESLTGGASAGGSSGGTPAPTIPGADILQPASVATAPALSSLAYLDEAGNVASQITVDWPDVSTNADGTPISDLGGYIIQTKPGLVNDPGEWREVTRTEAGTSIVTLSPYAPESTWAFRVMAYDTSGNLSPQWSAGNSITTAHDTDGPVAPSAPALETRMGVLEYRWDGLSGTGGAMDDDFFYVEVHASQVSGFVPVKGGSTKVDILQGAGFGVMGTPDYGVTWYVKFLPVDKSGNAGAPSAQSAIQVQLIQHTDISPGAVRTPALEAGSVTTEKISVGVRGSSVLLNSYMEEADGAGKPLHWVAVWGYSGVTLAGETAAPLSGTRSLRATIAGTADPNVLLGSGASDQPGTDGQKWYARVTVKAVQAMASRRVQVHGCTSTAITNPFSVFDPNTTWHAPGTSGDATGWAAGQTRTLTTTFTVPAGHTKVNVAVRLLGAGAASDAFIIDSIEMWPAVSDDQVTDISAGKLVTGIIQANQRVVAGSLTGARAEMNASGFQAYAVDGVTKTFEVKASDGSVFTAGAFTTMASVGSGRVVISAVQNPYQSGQTWATVQFFPDNINWDPALIWAAYGAGNPNWGVLQLTGPKLGTRSPARLGLRSEEQTNQTIIEMTANEIRASANTYRWGDSNGNRVVFQQTYAGANAIQGFAFLSAGGKRVEFNYGTLGQVSIKTEDENANHEVMELDATSIFFTTRGASGNVEMIGSAQQGNRVALACFSSNNSVVFSGGSPGPVRIKTWNGSDHIAIAASAFNVASDERFKRNARPAREYDRFTTGKRVAGRKAHQVATPKKAAAMTLLEKVRALEVYDYETTQGMARRATDDQPVEGFTQRGLMAQDVAEFWPDAVLDDDLEGSGAGVDLYYLLSTAWAAIQELADQVDTLKANQS